MDGWTLMYLFKQMAEKPCDSFPFCLYLLSCHISYKSMELLPKDHP